MWNACYKHFTLIGLKCIKCLHKSMELVGTTPKLPNQLIGLILKLLFSFIMKSVQSMWNACSKQFTLIGYFSCNYNDKISTTREFYLEKYPINVNCLLQAFHIDWALFIDEFLDQSMNVECLLIWQSDSMWHLICQD